MSWTRRFLVLVAFGLMLAGVALMISEKEELFLVLSIAGFALVLAAVPSLPKEAVDEEIAVERSGPAGERERLPEEPPSAAVTLVPNVPADQQAPERRAEGAAAPPATGRAKPEEPVRTPSEGAVEASGERRGAPPAEREVSAPEGPQPAGDGEGTAPPRREEPAQGSEELPRRREEPVPAPAAEPVPSALPPPVGATSPTRKLAIGATAAGATVLLWRWLRR